MEKVKKYRQIVHSLIAELGQPKRPLADWEILTVMDDERGHYLLVNSGWRDEHRIYGNLLHIEVNNSGKVLIRHNGMEESVAEQLVVRGIPREAIVLDLQPPYKRPYTGYAVA